MERDLYKMMCKKHNKPIVMLNQCEDCKNEILSKKIFPLNIVSKSLKKVLDFCYWCESTFNTDKLTGITYVHTKDDKHYLGLTFSKEKYQTRAHKKASKKFHTIYKHEEKVMELVRLSKISFIGNFSYKLIRGRK